MNRLFVVNKPIFISSNNYMYHIKRKYDTKKVGFSGTLDPFATGTLIVATGTFTKLFQFLNKEPKVYRATMWFGVESDSFDIENIRSVEHDVEIDFDKIEKILEGFTGMHEYLPPKYSAKKIDGKRAYEMARKNIDIELKTITSEVFNINLINYNYPFLTFEISVSEGSYIRSLAQIIAKKLGAKATLSALHRVSEGEFVFDNEEPLNPYDFLKLKRNKFLDEQEVLELGKKLDINQFELKNSGVYLIETDNFYSIIEITDKEIKYRLNRLPKEYK